MPSTVQPKTRSAKPPRLDKTLESTLIGLCSTCVNSPICVYRKDRGKDALFCEMFDNGNGSSSASTVTLVAPVKQAAKGKSNLKGLCVNCENRDSCTLLKVESGVWHCEEYR